MLHTRGGVSNLRNSSRQSINRTLALTVTANAAQLASIRARPEAAATRAAQGAAQPAQPAWIRPLRPLAAAAIVTSACGLPAAPPRCTDNTCLYRAMLGALGQVHREFPELAPS